jgi:hypothetical protein
MIASLVIGGVILLAMIGVSCYGWVTLPANARVPIHFGAGYNNFVPKGLGLVMHPAAGVVTYVISAATTATRLKRHRPSTSFPSSCASCCSSRSARSRWPAADPG